MNRRNRWVFALLAVALLSPAEAATRYYSCFKVAERKSWQPVPHHHIAFFNGVRTSAEAGTRAADHLLEGTAGQVWYAERSSSLLYNTHNNLWFDLIETFAQRIEEANGDSIERYNLALDVASGRNDVWKDLLAENPGLKPFHNWLKRDLNRRLTDALKAGPSNVTQSDYERHKRKLRRWVGDNRELVLVGYSQGNLFANHAYEYLQQAHPNAFVDVIHIAPASTQTYGPHVLADRDLVIRALPGEVPPVNTSIPSLFQRPRSPEHGRDVLGHGLLNTYLHPELEPSYAIEQHLYDAIKPKQAEEATFWSHIPVRSVAVPSFGRPTPDMSSYAVNGVPKSGNVTFDQSFARPYMKKDCFYNNAGRWLEVYRCEDHGAVDLETFKLRDGCEWVTLRAPTRKQTYCMDFIGRHYDGSLHLTAIIDRNGILRYHTEKPYRIRSYLQGGEHRCNFSSLTGNLALNDLNGQSLTSPDDVRYIPE